MSKEEKCPSCHKVGFHKMSCPTQKVTVFLSDEKTDNFFEEQEKKYLNGIRDQIEKLTPSDYDPMPKETVSIFNTFIPTLEGEEAEEFIRKADENVKAMQMRIVDKAIELQERYDNDYRKMQELISKGSNVVTEEDLKRMSRCKNHVWRKDYLNGGKKCQVCNKPKDAV